MLSFQSDYHPCMKISHTFTNADVHRVYSRKDKPQSSPIPQAAVFLTYSWCVWSNYGQKPDWQSCVSTNWPHQLTPCILERNRETCLGGTSWTKYKLIPRITWNLLSMLQLQVSWSTTGTWSRCFTGRFSTTPDPSFYSAVRIPGLYRLALGHVKILQRPGLDNTK
jgi:hypothetical protein